MTSRIYLDYAATTPVRREVLDAMLPFFSQNAYNASSVHAEGRAARAALDEARERVAACIGARPKEIVFTSGGSEADNLALFGVARAGAPVGGPIVASAIEHRAVLHALEALSDEGHSTARIPVTSSGLIDEPKYGDALRGKPRLVSIMYVNNELGVIEPIERLADAAHEAGALFHTDAVQAAPYFALDVERLGVDLLTLSAHKLRGPKGIGALYVRDGTPLRPLIVGGSQEFARRAGTQNVAGAVGFATALELAQREREEAAARVAAMRDEFEGALMRRVPDVRINGGDAPRAPHISNVSFKGARSEQLLLRLDLDGVAVSAGSACASGAIEASHVIAALGVPPEWANGVLRFSFGPTTTDDEVTRALGIVERAAAFACF